MGIENINDVNTSISNISEQREYDHNLKDIYKTLGLEKAGVVDEAAKDVNTTRTAVEVTALSGKVSGEEAKKNPEEEQKINFDAYKKSLELCDTKKALDTKFLDISNNKTKLSLDQFDELSKIKDNMKAKFEEAKKVKDLGNGFIDKSMFDYIKTDGKDILNSAEFLGSDAWSKISAIKVYSDYVGKNKDAIIELNTNKKKIYLQKVGPFIVEIGGNSFSYNRKDLALNRIDELQDWFEGREGFSAQSGVEAVGNVLSDLGGLGLTGLEFTLDIVNNTLQIIVEGTVIYLDYDFSDDQQTDYIIKGILLVVQTAVIYSLYVKNLKNPIEKGLDKARTGLVESELNKYISNVEKMSSLKEQYGITDSIESKLFTESGTYNQTTEAGIPDYARRTAKIYRHIKEGLGSTWFVGKGENLVNSFTDNYRNNKKSGIIEFLASVLNKGNKGKGILNWKISSQSSIVKSGSENIGKNFDKLSKIISLIESTDFTPRKKEELIKKLFKLSKNTLVNNDKKLGKFLSNELGGLFSDGDLKKFISRPKNINANIESSKVDLKNEYLKFIETFSEINDNLESDLKSKLNIITIISYNDNDLKTRITKLLKDNNINYSYDDIKNMIPADGDMIRTDSSKSTLLHDFDSVLRMMEGNGEIDLTELNNRYNSYENFLNNKGIYSNKHFSIIFEKLINGGEYNPKIDVIPYADTIGYRPYDIFLSNIINNLKGNSLPTINGSPAQQNHNNNGGQSLNTGNNTSRQTPAENRLIKWFNSVNPLNTKKDKLEVLKKARKYKQEINRLTGLIDSQTNINSLNTIKNDIELIKNSDIFQNNLSYFEKSINKYEVKFGAKESILNTSHPNSNQTQQGPNQGNNTISQTIDERIDSLTNNELNKKYSKFSKMLKSIELELILKGKLIESEEVRNIIDNMNTIDGFKDYLKSFYSSERLNLNKNLARFYKSKYGLSDIRDYKQLVDNFNKSLKNSSNSKLSGINNIGDLLGKIRDTTISPDAKNSIIDGLKNFQFRDVIKNIENFKLTKLI